MNSSVHSTALVPSSAASTRGNRYGGFVVSTVFAVLLPTVFPSDGFCVLFLVRFPLYYELKIAFVIWLLSPYTRGASLIYRKFLHPLLSSKERVRSTSSHHILPFSSVCVSLIKRGCLALILNKTSRAWGCTPRRQRRADLFKF